MQRAEILTLRLLALYGTKFSDMWRVVDPIKMKLVWAAELAHLSDSDIETGLKACMSRDWPPSLPEFVKMCNPALDPSQAFAEAQAGAWARARGEIGTWSSPAVYWAYVRFGAYDLKQSSYQSVRGRWDSVYLNALQDLRAGNLPEIPKPVSQLVAPGQNVTSKEEGAKRIAEIARKLAGSKRVLDPR